MLGVCINPTATGMLDGLWNCLLFCIRYLSPSGLNNLRGKVVQLSAARADERFAVGLKLWVSIDLLESDDKQDKIHELDAVVAHLYGLSGLSWSIFLRRSMRWHYEARLNEVLKHYHAWAARLRPCVTSQISSTILTATR